MSQKQAVQSNKGHGIRPLTSGRKGTRLLISVLIPAVLLLVIAVRWDFYYDLNDDSAMANILSGAYTGTPALRNIQSYFPLTALLGGLQLLIGGVPWYGIFLVGLQFGCLAVVLYRILRPDTERPSAAAVAAGTAAAHLPEETGEKVSRAGEREGMSNEAGGSVGRWAAILMCLPAALVFFGMLLEHLVFVQYSVTVGIMAATAAFLFLTMRPAETAKGWIREILPQLLLLWIGFLLRSEMLLFLSPLIALAFLIRLAEMEGTILQKGKACVLTLTLVLAGLGAGYLGNAAGYSSEAWKTFYDFFDARTQLYDFEKLPAYEGNEDFYESIGLTEAEAALIQNYNFGIDDGIDAETMQAIAEYAHEKAAAEQTFRQRFSNALWDVRHADDEPYTTIETMLYGLAVLAALLRLICELRAGEGSGENNDRSGRRAKRNFRSVGRFFLRLAEAAAVFLARSVLLLYLYYNQRPVERLTHSLYLVEAVILIWMVLRDAFAVSGGFAESICRQTVAGGGGEPSDRYGEAQTSAPGKDSGQRVPHRTVSVRAACAALLSAAPVVLFLWSASLQWAGTESEYAGREEINADWLAFLSYCEEHPENVYFTDVYSTVSFSEKIFADTPDAVNYDLLGGWMSTSPLELQKLTGLGLADSAAQTTGEIIQTALLEKDNCYYAAKSSYDTDWLTDYYASRGIEAEVLPFETIGEYWTIYSVREAP